MTRDRRSDAGQAALSLCIRWLRFQLEGLQTLVEQGDGDRGRYVVDLDAAPRVPNGWWVRAEDQLPHRATGRIDFTSSRVGLHLVKAQEDDHVGLSRDWIANYLGFGDERHYYGRISGNSLCDELACVPVLSANVLDFFLANQHLIPEAWKRKNVYFWGTVYRDARWRRYVRFLGWFGDRWSWSYQSLDGKWESCCPASVLARR